MQIAICADLHFRGLDLPAVAAQWRALLDDLTSRRITTLLCAGDIFEAANIGDADAGTGRVTDAFLEPLFKWLRYDPRKRFITTIGNHDYTGPGEPDCLTFLNAVPSVTVIREPSVITPHPFQLITVPWLWYSERSPVQITDELLAKSNPDMPRVLLAHWEVIGANMGHQAHAKVKNVSWQVPLEYLNEIEAQGIHVRSGHFHRRQRHFVGALRQQDKGEAGNPMGYEILDLDTRLSTWVELQEAPAYQVTHAHDEEELLRILDQHHSSGGSDIVKCHGFVPTAEARAALRQRNIEIDYTIPREQRTARVILPDNALDDPEALLTAWAKTQTPAWDEERITGMIERFRSLTAEAEFREAV